MEDLYAAAADGGCALSISGCGAPARPKRRNPGRAKEAKLLRIEAEVGWADTGVEGSTGTWSSSDADSRLSSFSFDGGVVVIRSNDVYARSNHQSWSMDGGKQNHTLTTHGAGPTLGLALTPRRRLRGVRL